MPVCHAGSDSDASSGIGCGDRTAANLSPRSTDAPAAPCQTKMKTPARAIVASARLQKPNFANRSFAVTEGSGGGCAQHPYRALSFVPDNPTFVAPETP